MRIPIRYSGFGHAVLSVLGAPAPTAYLEVRGDLVHARMGWMFHTTFPLSSVAAVAPMRSSASLGVHGWNGRWLVNGAWSPLASITLSSPVRAFVLGFPVVLRELMVSVDDPAALQAELARAHAL